jgi:hypothetical protein
MMQKLGATAVIALLVSATASLALCADIVGTVSDTLGNPVRNVQITARTSAGKAVAQALTSADGRYQITSLNPGIYDYALNPLQTGFKAGSAVSYLNSKGLTINWKLSATATAIALASEGTEVALADDPFGMTWPEFVGLVGGTIGFVAGGVVGGCAAAGCFSSSSSSPPAGPGSSRPASPAL